MLLVCSDKNLRFQKVTAGRSAESELPEFSKGDGCKLRACALASFHRPGAAALALRSRSK